MFWFLLLVFVIAPIVWHARTFDSAQASCSSALLSGTVAGLAVGWTQGSVALGFVTFFPATFIALGYGVLAGKFFRQFGNDGRRAHAAQKALQPVPLRRHALNGAGILSIGIALLAVAVVQHRQTGEWSLRPGPILTVTLLCLVGGAAVLVRIYVATRRRPHEVAFLRRFLVPFAITYPVWASVLAIPVLRIAPELYWPVVLIALAGLVDWSIHIRHWLPPGVTRRVPFGAVAWFVLGIAVAFAAEWLVQCAWLRWCR
ncbi:MAG: hypothetical protein ACO1PB_00570 [Ramlibacter sp.]